MLFQSMKDYCWDAEFAPSDPDGEPEIGVMTLNFSRVGPEHYVVSGSFILKETFRYYLHGSAMMVEDDLHMSLDGAAVLEIDGESFVSGGKTIAVIDPVTKNGSFQGREILMKKSDGALVKEYFQGALTFKGDGAECDEKKGCGKL